MSRDPAGVAVVDAELVALLRRLKLGRTLDTLPERLTLARTQALPHAEFLSLVLADEVARRDVASADLRAHSTRRCGWTPSTPTPAPGWTGRSGMS